MSCDLWRDKMDAYGDAELPNRELAELEAHMRECPSCAADALGRLQLKRMVQSAGRRYAPAPEFRLRVEHKIARPRHSRWAWRWLPALAGGAAALALVFVIAGIWSSHPAREQALTELADLHVTALASANPVDVVSSDRHTVKPWFQGRLPFSFDLPDLENSPFRLIGGRMAYVEHNPGAQLLFQVRKHYLSVFVVQEQPAWRGLFPDRTLVRKLAFNMETWTQDGLRYFLITDASTADIQQLGELLRKAAQ